MPEKPANPSDQQVHRVELALSYLLRTGVIISTLLVLTGIFIMFLHHPEYLTLPAQTVIQQMRFPHTLSDVFTELAHGEGRAIILCGIFVLIATPVLRVAVSVVIFFHQKDRLFTGITLLVLFLLLTSFLLGNAGG